MVPDGWVRKTINGVSDNLYGFSDLPSTWTTTFSLFPFPPFFLKMSSITIPHDHTALTHPALTKTVDAILDEHLGAGLIQPPHLFESAPFDRISFKKALTFASRLN